MAENKKYVDCLTEAESEDMAVIVNKTIKEICLFSDKHNFDRDNMLKYYAGLIGTFTEIATIQGFEVENPHTNADRIRSMTNEELVSVVVCPDSVTGGDTDCNQYHDCKECTLDWLQKESEV
jgi:hypothetical protein